MSSKSQVIAFLLFILLCILGGRPLFAQTAPAQTVTPTTPPAVAPPAPVTAPPDATSTASQTSVTSTADIDKGVTFLEPYVFDLGEGRRNPFQPPAVLGSANPMLPGSPLEMYDLNEIKLVGIMWNVNHPKAMFVDPTGHVYVLGIDDRIGRKHGYIAAIRDGEVVVMEATNYNGQPTYAPRILQISQENQSSQGNK